MSRAEATTTDRPNIERNDDRMTMQSETVMGDDDEIEHTWSSFVDFVFYTTASEGIRDGAWEHFIVM